VCSSDLKNYELNPISLNPDDKIDKEYIMKTILPSLKTKQSFSKKNNILIIHVIDCYDDNGFISCIVNCLKNTKIPVIATCNNRYDKSLKPIISYCLDVKFQKPTAADIIVFLKPILKLENITISESSLKQIIEDYYCDVRSVLNSLQFNHKSITRNNNTKDQTMSNIFDNTKLFMSQNIEMIEKQSLFWLNNDLLPLMIHENYPYNNIKMKNEVLYLNNIADSIDSISDLDIIEKEIHTNSCWELLPYTAWLSIKGVSNCHAKTQIKFTSFFEKNSIKKQNMNKSILHSSRNDNTGNSSVKSKNVKTTSEKSKNKPNPKPNPKPKVTNIKKNKDVPTTIKSEEKPKIVKRKKVQLIIEE
jgi:replication factor C subunit 1